jgi:hypothetical protein
MAANHDNERIWVMVNRFLGVTWAHAPTAMPARRMAEQGRRPVDSLVEVQAPTAMTDLDE